MRPLERADIGRVAKLHREAFGHSRPLDEVERFLAEVLFEHPWYDPGIQSLKLATDDGTVVGCLGAMPRPMLLDGRPLRAVVSNNFMVDPAYRGGLVAIELMRRAARDGRQLALSETNDTGRTISLALGARHLTVRSRRWVRVLRPTAFALRVGDARLHPRVVRVAGALGRPLDSLAASLAPPYGLNAEDPDLEPEAFAELVAAASSRARLRPVYDTDSARWLFDVLRRSRKNQQFRKRMVPGSRGGGPLGWYLYFSRAGGVARVLQVDAASPDDYGRVLDHLFADAHRQGNVGVTGQVDPGREEMLTTHLCPTREGGSWVLAHTTDPELESILDTPEAFLTRMEGEGWLRFAF